MELTAAIRAALAASDSLTAADSRQLAAQSSFDAAATAKADADTADVLALQAFNSSMEALSETALASRITRTPQLSPAPQGPIATIPTTEQPAA